MIRRGFSSVVAIFVVVSVITVTSLNGSDRGVMLDVGMRLLFTYIVRGCVSLGAFGSINVHA